MEINLNGLIAWLLIVPSFLVYLLGFLMIVDRVLLYFDKFLKHITNQRDLWGIMRQAAKIYYQNKKVNQNDK